MENIIEVKFKDGDEELSVQVWESVANRFLLEDGQLVEDLSTQLNILEANINYFNEKKSNIKRLPD